MSSRRGVGALYDRYLKKLPQQSRSRHVVEAILGAVVDTISRGAHEERLTVEQIAARAGVGIGSLYDYFGDRKSVLSAVAAKLTEDNLEVLEARLAGSRERPLDVAVRDLVDYLFAIYLGDPKIPRAVLRVAHQIGLMPTLAASQTMFARTLAAALRERSDVRVEDAELTAWAMTNMTMGVIHTRIWHDDAPFADDVLKAEITKVWLAHLRI